MLGIAGAVFFGCAEGNEPEPPGSSGPGGSGGEGGFGGQGGAGEGGMGGSGGSGGQGGGTPVEPFSVIECPDAISAPPATGTCTVAKEGTSGVMLRGTVLGPDRTYRQGQVLVSSAGLIACVGCDCAAAPEAANASIIDCPEGVISPGLINPHDHIGFANTPPYVAPDPTIRYDHRHEWRKGAVPGKPKISTLGTASAAAVQLAELRFVLSGATSAVSAGGQAGLLRNLDAPGKLEGLTVKPAESDTFPLNDSAGMMIESGCDAYGANPTTAAEIEDFDGYLPHISEGVNLAARNEFVCTSTGLLDVIAPQTAVVHAVGIIADDIAAMHADLTKVVWSPRSNVSLYGNTASVTLLDYLGVPITLGTDWLPTGSMNILRELRCADELNAMYYGSHFSDIDLWQMVTSNAALAAGAERGIGSLKTAYAADISVFDAKVRKDHRAVVGAEPQDVVLVLRGGKPLYGDAELLDSAAIGGAACEALDVCGVQKKACVAKDIGTTSLQSLLTLANTSYPLFFCGTPADEPSCVPYRKGEYEGILTVSDADGDGIEDAVDNCPKIFNPVRLLEAVQADMDGDKTGDVCDKCPFDATDACTPPDADDIDADGVINAVDNCPRDTNADQADKDADGHGDVCDTCAAANPGASVCPTTIEAIRDPSNPEHPAVGDIVSIKDVYVTAVRPDTGSSRGFYIQDDSLKPFTGIFVFTASKSPGVSVGNKVSLTGRYDEYFTLSELADVVVTNNDGGMALPFGPVAIANPADIGTGGALAEQYESMLLEIGKTYIVVQNADAPNDYDEFVVSDNAMSITGLRIDDVIFQALNNTCPVGTVFEKMIGIGTYTFNNAKLEPRSAADITLPANSPCSPF